MKYINGYKVAHTFECNHKEADTQTILHAALSSEDAFFVAADTDDLILMNYAYSKYMIKRRWVFRYEIDKKADIETILLHLDK